MASKAPTWLITGTSNGFGLALAQHVLRANHNLISISRHPQPHELLTSIVSSSGTKTSKPTLHHLQHDLSNKDETKIKSTISDFLSRHPETTVDVVVNNAAIAAFAPVETIPTSTVEKLMTVNFYSPLWLIQSVLPNMRTATNAIPKVIANISSTQGLCCDPAELAYEASKHALEALSGVIAHEIQPFGIRTLVANLGSFRTAFATSGDREGLSSSASRTSDTSSTDKNASAPPSSSDDPYTDPSHPTRKRIDMVMKLANVPNVARGDPAKGAAILFDAIMCTPGSEADAALHKQRSDAATVGPLERILIGSDGWPKIHGSIEALKMQVEVCEKVAKLSNADDVK